MEKFKEKIIIIFFFVFGIHSNLMLGQNSQISREDVLSRLNYLNIGRIPDTMWTDIFNSSFDYIKSGDSLIFSKTLEFTQDSKYLLKDYLQLYWQELLFNHTEIFLTLTNSKTIYEKNWLIHFSLLDSETITQLETNNLIAKLKSLLNSPNGEMASTAKFYLERYDKKNNRTYWQ